MPPRGVVVHKMLIIEVRQVGENTGACSYHELIGFQRLPGNTDARIEIFVIRKYQRLARFSRKPQRSPKGQAYQEAIPRFGQKQEGVLGVTAKGIIHGVRLGANQYAVTGTGKRRPGWHKGYEVIPLIKGKSPVLIS